MLTLEETESGMIAWTQTVDGRESYGIASDMDMALLVIMKGKEREDEPGKSQENQELHLQAAI